MKFLRRAFALACMALLLSCGGGALDVVINGGGVGTGGTGIVAGTLTGLGSVIVDGVRYDDSQAALESRPDLRHSQALTLADLQVGQYVYLDLDAAGNPTRVRVESQLVGPVGATAQGGTQFTLWGQTVVINTDPSRGPVTVLAGYRGASDIRPGDPIQVYGVLQATDNGSEVIRASRIERLPAAGSPPARVSGTLRAGASGLLLAGVPLDVSTAGSVPALAAGVPVTVVVPWSSAIPAKWQAASVALLAPPATPQLRVSGSVHLLSNGRALVQGVAVDLSRLSPGDRQAVREGSYLTVSGSSDEDGREGVASSVEGLPASGRPTELHGSITAVNGTTTFVVRGQVIDAGSATFSGGSARDLVVGSFVEVDGIQTPAGVTATRITIESVPPANAVLDVAGAVQSVDDSTGEVRVRTADGKTVELKFAPGTPLPTSGQTVRISGYWNGTEVKVRDVED